MRDPSFVYLRRHWRHSCDKIYQAFPLRFCILQAIENLTVGRPGNEASFKCNNAIEIHGGIIFNFYTGTVTCLISDILTVYLYIYLNVHVIQCPSRFTLRAGFCGYLFTTFLKLSFTVVGGMEAGPDSVVWNEDMKNKEVQVTMSSHIYMLRMSNSGVGRWDPTRMLHMQKSWKCSTCL